MALMHCCCFCCTPKSGSIVIGVLQLLSLIIGAGLVGLLLTAVKFVQEESKIKEILEDFFEVSFPEGWDGQLDALQGTLEDRTIIAEKVLYGSLGYIGLDFILTCVMIHGARTNGPKLLIPWVILNGLRSGASLAAGIYAMIKKSEWAESLAKELNNLLSDAVTSPPNSTPDPDPGSPDMPQADPQMLETALTSMAGILIAGSLMSLYFVLVVYSQFQIIRSNRSQTRRVQHRMSLASGLLSNSPSFYNNAGAPNGNGVYGDNGFTQMPMHHMPSVYGGGDDGFDNPVFTPNAPPVSSTPVKNGKPKGSFMDQHNGYGHQYNDYGAATAGNGFNFSSGGGNKRPSRGMLYPDVVSTGRRTSQGQGQGQGNYQVGRGTNYPLWQSPGKGFSEPMPDYE